MFYFRKEKKKTPSGFYLVGGGFVTVFATTLPFWSAQSLDYIRLRVNDLRRHTVAKVLLSTAVLAEKPA